MKTKKMISVMENYCDYLNENSKSDEHEYEVNVTNEEIIITDNNTFGFPRAYVSETEMDKYEFTLTSDVEYDDYHVRKLIKALLKYSRTPLEQRKDEKRWYIHLVEDSEAYLNLDIKEDRYFISNKEEYRSYQTKFTRSEIEDWAGNDSDEVINLIINKFGEEVKE